MDWKTERKKSSAAPAAAERAACCDACQWGTGESVDQNVRNDSECMRNWKSTAEREGKPEEQ